MIKFGMGQNTFWTKANITKDDMKLKLKGEKLKPKGPLLSKKDKKANIEDTKRAMREFNNKIIFKKAVRETRHDIKLLLNPKNEDPSLRKHLIKKIQKTDPDELKKNLDRLSGKTKIKIINEIIDDIFLKEHLPIESFNSYLREKNFQAFGRNKYKSDDHRIAKIRGNWLFSIVSSCSKKRKE